MVSLRGKDLRLALGSERHRTNEGRELLKASKPTFCIEKHGL